MEAGRIESYLYSDGITENKTGSLVKVTCQTDFAARTFEFREFAQRIARLVCGFQAETYDQLKVQMPAIEQERLNLEATLKEKVTVTTISLIKLQL
jgi:translation elongation factor EF-Ts